MSRVRFNVAANIAGQTWSVLLAIVCTPFLIKFLGIEGYALIAFYTVLQASLQMLDLGLATTVNREVARLSTRTDTAGAEALGAFVATAQRWYWISGSGIGLAMCIATPYIATVWLHPQNLSPDELAESARLFGLLACLQWIISFYQNGLIGLQRQTTLNQITIPFSALSNLGGLAVLWLGPPSVTTLFVWQTLVLLVQVAVISGRFWGCVGIPPEARTVNLAILMDTWRFSLGMGGISVTGFILGYLDKLILSRLLTLESFGHYNLGSTLARSLYVLITPVFNAYFPRFSALAASDDKASMRLCYHSATQVMSVLILPLAAIIAVFPFEIGFLWLQDSSIAKEVAPIASLLAVGNCLNGLMNIPFALQLANGNTRIGLYLSSCLVASMAPAMIFAASQYGVVGGAATWVVINALHLLIGLPITHKFLLPGETSAWFRFDVLPPFLAALVVVGVGRMVLQHDQSALFTLLVIGLTWLLATAAASFSTGQVRGTIQHLFNVRF